MRMILSLIGYGIRRKPLQWAVLALLLCATSVLWVIEPVYSSYAVDELLKIAQGETVNYPRLFLFWGAIFLSLSITQSFEKYLQWKLTMGMELDFTQRLYRHVLNLPVAFHVQQKSGEAMKVIDEAGTELAYVTRIIVDLIPSVLSSIAFLIISVMIQPMLAAILLGSMILYCGIIVIGSMKTMKLQERANKAWVKPTGRAFDVMTNIFTVKSAGHEQKEVDRMKRGHDSVFKWQLKVNKRWAFIEAMNFFMLTRILLVALGIWLLARGQLTLGEVYYFQLSFFRVLIPFEILANALPGWNKSVSKVRLANNLFTIKAEESDAKGTTVLKDLKGAVEFQNVSFAYDRSQPPVLSTDDDDDRLSIDAFLNDPANTEGAESLHSKMHGKQHTDRELSDEAEKMDAIAVLHDINLTVKAGEHIAFVGHSGAGKSTIAMLLNRFYNPSTGAILVDGHDLKTLDRKWWRRRIGLVLQDNMMFNETLLENIRYTRPDATDEDIVEAARRASADEFIGRLQYKYDTMVGERGIKLSGGERQRIAIARAILKKPSIVILDEATSALDSVTERKVQEGIKELIKGRTSFIIAHRLSTVRSVDRIAVIEEGRLTACAPHEELMKTSPTYRKMVELQREGLLAE